MDLLSDYDVVFAVTDADRFTRDDAWEAAYGTPMVRFSDAGELNHLTTYFHGVLYDDYIKIDYTIRPEALLEYVAAGTVLPDSLDVGYRVLLDKDGGTAAWKPPTFRAHIPAQPTEAEYKTLIEEFWWSTTYMAKSLCRGEVVFAKWCLDCELKVDVLRRLLEWRVELDHGWSVKPGVHGSGVVAGSYA